MNHTETLAQERIRTSALQRIIGSPATPALLVLLIALSMASIKLARFHFDPISFVLIDGSFVHLLARSFPSLDVPMDVPAYRAQRILLSALAAPFGPYEAWALIGLNVLSLVAGTYALARLAVRHRMPAILGAFFGLWIGALFVVEMDLTEVLAYGLVLWGILCWEADRRLLAGLLCGLAVLAKETTVLYGIAFLLAGGSWDWRARLRFGVLALGPGLIWQLVLLLTFGETGITAAGTRGAPAEHMLPIVGLLGATTVADWAWGVQIMWVLVPSLAALLWGGYLLWVERFPPVGWALIANGLFVISLPGASTNYMAHSARIGLAVVVALAWAIVRTRRPLLGLAALGLALAPLALFRVETYF
ncbi:MAG: hypothetical protein IPO81_14645 [Kouleothrix sp.]|nr:hypothetical protein [Kouleothrix sp.]